MFESEFLTSTDDNKRAFQSLILHAAEIVCQSYPQQPYSGRTPQVLAETIANNFLPDDANSWESISATLRNVISNSVAVTHPHTAAHLHCPPLMAAVAAEVVISALNQSMDSFDQAPIASIVEQNIIRWLCGEIGFTSFPSLLYFPRRGPSISDVMKASAPPCRWTTPEPA